MSDQDFMELAHAAEANPQDADFSALRQAYIESDTYSPTSHFSSNKLMGNTNSLNSFEEVIEFCESVLDKNPMDLEVRMLAEYACEQLDASDKAKRHHQFVRGMLHALFNTGDGKSPKTAWQVVAVAEEYTVLSVLGMKRHQQDLAEMGERYLDILTCTQRGQDSSPEIKLYFDITDPYTYLQNLME